jgi:hypothetical protein
MVRCAEHRRPSGSLWQLLQRGLRAAAARLASTGATAPPAPARRLPRALTPRAAPMAGPAGNPSTSVCCWTPPAGCRPKRVGSCPPCPPAAQTSPTGTSHHTPADHTTPHRCHTRPAVPAGFMAALSSALPAPADNPPLEPDPAALRWFKAAYPDALSTSRRDALAVRCAPRAGVQPHVCRGATPRVPGYTPRVPGCNPTRGTAHGRRAAASASAPRGPLLRTRLRARATRAA